MASSRSLRILKLAREINPTEIPTTSSEILCFDNAENIIILEDRDSVELAEKIKGITAQSENNESIQLADIAMNERSIVQLEEQYNILQDVFSIIEEEQHYTEMLPVASDETETSDFENKSIQSNYNFNTQNEVFSINELDNNPAESENNVDNHVLNSENEVAVTDENSESSGKRKGLTRNKRLKEKRQRLLGQEYEGLKRIGGNYRYEKTGKARQIGSRCTSARCTATKRFCSQFTETERADIFNTFWTKMTSWNSRRSFVSTLVDVKDSKKQKEKSRRSVTFYYYLKKQSNKFAVCKKMFLSTLGLKEWSVRNWCMSAEKNTGMHCTENEQLSISRVRCTATMKERKLFLEKFLNDMPKLPSHYCRSSSNKLYLEPMFQNKNDIYREFEKYAGEHNIKPLSRNYFVQEMERQNIALFRPKKDQCDICMAYQHGNIEEAEYSSHQKRKSEAREQKDKYKEMAISNPEHVLAITLDMQAVKLAPFLKCTSVYFKKKLCVHNYTLFNLRSKDVYCFLWDETQGSLEATNIASILYKFLDTYIIEHPKLQTVILISDGCGYQNRNVVLSNTLLYLAMKRRITIIQSFLEKGHTQMEVDSAHSLIERKLKNKDIYLPTDYIRICREARPKNAFIVKYLSFTDFFNLTAIKYYNNIRPGYKVGDPTVSDIRSLRYNCEGEITYKLNYSDEWSKFTRRPNLSENVCITNHYKERLKIKADKYEHLQVLKKEMDPIFWSYYETLPHY